MKLLLEHLDAQDGFKHVRFTQLEEQGYKPEYVDLHAHTSESSDKLYLIGKVECLTKPIEKADAAVDNTTVYLCSCPDYHFNRSKGFENNDKGPESLDECKHITRAVREKRAEADEKQETL